MKIAGHTMGTPEYTLEEAARLFREIGMDGIEIVFQSGYKCGMSMDTTDEQAREYKALLDSQGLEAVCITPYPSDFNSPLKEEREAVKREIYRCIELCRIMNARFIRIYGGRQLTGDYTDYDAKLEYLCISMRELGDEAQKYGITLVLENHFNTMTFDAAATVKIIRAIGHPAVKALYDQTNITFLNGEPAEIALPMQRDIIAYVHAKDMVFTKPDAVFKAADVTHVSKEERHVRSRIPGEGIIPWAYIVRTLQEYGYDGYLSMEYERRWHPDDLPDASIGMKQGCAYLKKLIAGEGMV